MNTTTIESNEVVYRSKDGDNDKKDPRFDPLDKSSAKANPYYVTVYDNICSVLGPKPHLWLIPVPTPGTGLSFPINKYFQDQSFSSSVPPFIEGSTSDDDHSE